jgi:hypothetical protein
MNIATSGDDGYLELMSDEDIAPVPSVIPVASRQDSPLPLSGRSPEFAAG